MHSPTATDVDGTDFYLDSQPVPPDVNRARKLGSETAYLRLSREDAVRELDARLAEAVEPETPPAISNVEKFLSAQMGVAPTPPRSPAVSPLMVGTFERTQCNYDVTKIAYIYHGVGGNDIIARLPVLADDAEVDACVRGLVDLVNRKLEERWVEMSRGR